MKNIQKYDKNIEKYNKNIETNDKVQKNAFVMLIAGMVTISSIFILSIRTSFNIEISFIENEE